MLNLFDCIIDKERLFRRVAVVANHAVRESSEVDSVPIEQLGLFTDYEELKWKKKRSRLPGSANGNHNRQ